MKHLYKGLFSNSICGNQQQRVSSDSMFFMETARYCKLCKAYGSQRVKLPREATKQNAETKGGTFYKRICEGGINKKG